jgi:hypothetical protein
MRPRAIAMEHGLDYLAALARVGPDRPPIAPATTATGRSDRLHAGAAAWLGGAAVEASDAALARQPTRRTCAAGSSAWRRCSPVTSRRARPAPVVERERARLADLEAELRLLSGG